MYKVTSQIQEGKEDPENLPINVAPREIHGPYTLVNNKALDTFIQTATANGQVKKR